MLAKSNLNSIEVLISNPLIDSVISHDKLVLINNAKGKYRNEGRDQKFKDLIRPLDLAMRMFIKEYRK